MKANSDRAHRLSFDGVAQVYDQARPGISDHLVTAIVQSAGLAPGDPVLEIGAGTGQLTVPLRAAGPQITALEPGEQLRALLSKKVVDDPGVTVRGELFEDFDAPRGSYAAVVSANAWQWLDPEISYAKAADLLRPGGHLALTWTFPIVADAFLQQDLNEAFANSYPDAVRDSSTHLPGLEARAAEGRAELVDSGRFAAPRWEFSSSAFALTPDAYFALLLSYANAAILNAAARADMAHRVRAVLADHSARTVHMINHLYLCIARVER